METALKELTIIDYLGMIVPGTALVFVFLLDQHEEEWWTSIINSDSALKLIVLLTAGYIAGMLLHEIGDILEKILWNCALLNPRCHAAKVIEKNDYSLLRMSEEKNVRDSESAEVQCKAARVIEKSDYSLLRMSGEKNVRDSDSAEAQYKAARVIEKSDYSLLRMSGEKNVRDSDSVKEQDKKEEKVWLTVIKGVGKNAVCGIILAVLIIFSLGGSFWNDSAMDRLLQVVVPCFVLIWIIFAWLFEESLPETVKNWVRKNAAIQTLIVGKGNEAKRRMFDGFYVMMRNLLLALVFIHIHMQFGGHVGTITTQILEILSNEMHGGIYIAAVLIMWERCFHYAYLKYKYSYENYLKYFKSI